MNKFNLGDTVYIIREVVDGSSIIEYNIEETTIVNMGIYTEDSSKVMYRVNNSDSDVISSYSILNRLEDEIFTTPEEAKEKIKEIYENLKKEIDEKIGRICQ